MKTADEDKMLNVNLLIVNEFCFYYIYFSSSSIC